MASMATRAAMSLRPLSGRRQPMRSQNSRDSCARCRAGRCAINRRNHTPADSAAGGYAECAPPPQSRSNRTRPSRGRPTPARNAYRSPPSPAVPRPRCTPATMSAASAKNPHGNAPQAPPDANTPRPSDRRRHPQRIPERHPAPTKTPPNPIPPEHPCARYNMDSSMCSATHPHGGQTLTSGRRRRHGRRSGKHPGRDAHVIRNQTPLKRPAYSRTGH